MKDSKERFRASATYDAATINAAYKTALYTYGKPLILLRVAIGAVLMLTVLFVHMSLVLSLPLMVIGCFLFVSYDFPARMRAQSYIRKHTGKPETKACRFLDDKIATKEEEKSYKDISRLVYDDNYLYIFFSRKDYIVIAIPTIVPHDTGELKTMVASKSGKAWDTVSLALLSHQERSEKRKEHKSL